VQNSGANGPAGRCPSRKTLWVNPSQRALWVNVNYFICQLVCKYYYLKNGHIFRMLAQRKENKGVELTGGGGNAGAGGRAWARGDFRALKSRLCPTEELAASGVTRHR
jgi:hypothetical protein